MTYKELKTFLMAFSKGMFPQFGGGGGGAAKQNHS